MPLPRVLAAAAVLVGGAVVAPAASADCASPSITVSPEQARPGDRVTISGAAFGTACHDMGPSTLPPLGDPAADVDLVLHDGAVTLTLATVDADADYAIEERVTVPRDVTGDVEITAALAEGYDTDPVVLEVVGVAGPPSGGPAHRPAVVQTDSPPAMRDRGPAVLGAAGLVALAAGVGVRGWRRRGPARS